MNDVPMLFPVNPDEFWRQIKRIVQEAIREQIDKKAPVVQSGLIPEKPLYKLADLCLIFHVSKPTLYEWIRDGKLRSFKIRNRRYFTRNDIEALMQGKHLPQSPPFPSKPA